MPGFLTTDNYDRMYVRITMPGCMKNPMTGWVRNPYQSRITLSGKCQTISKVIYAYSSSSCFNRCTFYGKLYNKSLP